jgi:hypothetical protein
MSSRLVSSVFAAVAMLGLGTFTVAADGLASRLQAVAKSCDADIQTYCTGMTPGGGKIVRCLGANYMSVSPSCRATMASAMNDICGQDLARLCPGSALGSGQAESCLQSHIAELKGACKSAADRLAAR